MELKDGLKMSSKKAEGRAIVTATSPKNKTKNAIEFILCCIVIMCDSSKEKVYKQEEEVRKRRGGGEIILK
jgi:hypothetical protein